MSVLVTIGNKSYLGDDMLEALRTAIKLQSAYAHNAHNKDNPAEMLRHATIWVQVPMTYTALRRMIDVAADQLKLEE